VYGPSYYWNFRTSSFKQVACLILLLLYDALLVCGRNWQLLFLCKTQFIRE